jgi:hypothetical protein
MGDTVEQGDVAEEIVLDETVPQDLQEDDMDDGTLQDGGEESMEDFVDESIQVYIPNIDYRDSLNIESQFIQLLFIP